MHRETGERRDFLPPLAASVAALGSRCFVESTIGSGMGLSDDDYESVSPLVRAVPHEEAYAQQIVVVLRSPDERFELLRPGATLVAMLHFSLHGSRVHRLKELGVEAISLDLVTDDNGRRLVENMEAVAWNALDAAFGVLERSYDSFFDAARPPLHVTVMGAGMIGKHAVEAATKYGSRARNDACRDLLGVEVTTIGRALTRDESYMRERLRGTDILVDAALRRDASRPMVPNQWIAELPGHAVICDMAVDPYMLEEESPTVRGIEGIPQGDLDQYVFWPDDAAWDATIPPEIPTEHRRVVVSSYSWPGIHPKPCMQRYGEQLAPLLQRLVALGGAGELTPRGGYLERALYRASLRRWAELV
jgi:alanine dehydrogenase